MGTTIDSVGQCTVRLIAPPADPAAVRRAGGLAAVLRAEGVNATVCSPRAAALSFRHRPACFITVSASGAAHLLGRVLARRGCGWIADLDATAVNRLSRAARRAVVAADALSCPTEDDRRAIFASLGSSAAVLREGDGAALRRQLAAVSSGWRNPERLRILMVGPVNSPHMEDLAVAMQQRGHVVRAGGAHWGGLPPSRLPDAGIPVSVMTRPQPLWFRRLIRRFEPDVVHANWMLFAAAAALSGARPLVAMAWGSDVYGVGRLATLLNRLAARRADRCIGDSEDLVARLVELGAPRKRSAVINWGVDTTAFRPPASPGERAGLKATLGLGPGPVVLSVRGFKGIYNPETLLQAYAALADEFPDAQLVLKHPETAPMDLPWLTRSDRVHVVGRVPYERLAAYLRSADISVSIPDSDSSPRSVWEAMACGSACILSDLPWVHELIRPEEHALVVPIEPVAVTGALRRLLGDSELRERLAVNARRLVEEHRDADREMERLEEIYVSLAGRRPSPIASSSTAARSPASLRRE